jgi:FKBP-type peptidyl-prolyl cis-trans isomerase FkpA
MTSRFLVVLVLAAAVSACKGDTPTSPSVNANVPYSQTDLRVGTGAEAVVGSRVSVAYAGWLYDPISTQNKGQQFDAGQFSFTVGQGVIPGFSQMVTGMRVGGQRRAVLPPNLGYGSGGNPQAGIPGNATLVFEVELLAIQ